VLHRRLLSGIGSQCPNESTTISVHNLAPDIGTKELRSYFSNFGEISQVTMPKNKSTGLAGGFGYVKYKNRQAAASAINKENHEIDGRIVRLKEARPAPDRGSANKQALAPTSRVEIFVHHLQHCKPQAAAVSNVLAEYGNNLGLNGVKAILKALGRQKDATRILLVFDLVQKKGIMLDTIVYNMAISACAKERQWAKALALLAEMPGKGIAQSVYSYSSAISACEKGRQWEMALELLAEMPGKGITPNTITYNSAISACEKGGQWEKALELLAEMPGKGIVPNAITYNSAISACEKGRQWEKALELLAEMRERRCGKGAGHDTITYNSAINACARERQWEKALELLAEMQEKNIAPNRITYSEVLDAAVAERAVAREVFRDALKLKLFASPVRRGSHSWDFDIRDHSEGSAFTACCWWIEEEIRPWLDQQPSSAYSKTKVQLITGHGRCLDARQTFDVEEAVLQALLQMEVPVCTADTKPGRISVDCASWMQPRRE
jgi:pentatricopeptide repeat protein